MSAIQIANLTKKFIREFSAILDERTDAKRKWAKYVHASVESENSFVTAVEPWHGQIKWPNTQGDGGEIEVSVTTRSPYNDALIGAKFSIAWSIETFRIVSISYGKNEQDDVSLDEFIGKPLLQHIYEYLEPTYNALLERLESPTVADADDELGL